MNKALFSYYFSVFCLAIGCFIFYKTISLNNVSKIGFSCVVANTCPEKWMPRELKEVDHQKFLKILKIGHQLNAIVSYKIDISELILIQKYNNNCLNFEVAYFFKISDNKFKLTKIEGLDLLFDMPTIVLNDRES